MPILYRNNHAAACDSSRASVEIAVFWSPLNGRTRRFSILLHLSDDIPPPGFFFGRRANL
jgi:hypothetical protein